MVIRHGSTPEAVTQPAHAWVAGQIGRAWGSEMFPRPALFEELIYATDQHDIGHTQWERAPTLDPETRLPHTFKTLPGEIHLRLWRCGIEWMLPTSRFAALLISRHAAGLYHRHFDWIQSSVEEQRLVKEFLAGQEPLQRALKESLLASERYAVLRDEAALEYFSFLLGTWDLLSLHVCSFPGEPLDLPEVPAAGGFQSLTLRPAGGSPNRWRVAPWPFQKSEVPLHFECRPLNPPYESEQDLHSDLGQARPRLIEAMFTKD